MSRDSLCTHTMLPPSSAASASGYLEVAACLATSAFVAAFLPVEGRLRECTRFAGEVTSQEVLYSSEE